jgi:hypothetical protein
VRSLGAQFIGELIVVAWTFGFAFTFVLSVHWLREIGVIDMGRGGWIWAWLTIAAVAVAITLGLTGPSPAQDRGAWFKSLKAPNGASCCDISDCMQTEAQWQGGGWFATHPSGRKVPVPPEVVLKRPMSIDGEAYACWLGASTALRCFVPPSPGS